MVAGILEGARLQTHRFKPPSLAEDTRPTRLGPGDAIARADLPFLPKPGYLLLACCSQAWEAPMNKPFFSQRMRSTILIAGLAAFLAAGTAPAQITIDTRTGTVTNGTNGPAATVDRRYSQIEPTKVPLTKSELDAKTRLELIRLLQSEQGFAMRPLPRGRKGLTLVANGKLEPAGEPYMSMVTSEGLSAKPGDRVVLTDIKFDRSKIVFDLNGGPDRKHRFLRHIQIGNSTSMSPVMQGDDPEPVGARLSLAFADHVPELTGAEVKALLAPLITFDVKTPVQAFTDTLPSKLKDAILNHHVLVGMTTDMVLFAKGQPESKIREMDGQMPFEEWIYGKPPKDVEFVRINGNRVIRVEVAKMGETPVIFSDDVVEGMMRADGTPVISGDPPNTKTVELGDAKERDPNTQAPLAPPSLRKPGETLPEIDGPMGDSRVGVMKPVHPIKPKPAPQPGANPDGEPEAQPAQNVQPPPADASQPAPVKPQARPPQN